MAQGVHHIHCYIYGIHALIARCMTGNARHFAIQHHQSFFGNGRLHGGGFAHQGKIDGRQHRQHGFHPVFAAHFLLGRGKENQIIGLGGAGERSKSRQQRHHRSTVVVGAKSVDGIAFLCGGKGMVLPSGSHLHRVDMGIQQNGGLLR